jgi:long-chain fatty acid transport protein
MKNILRNSISKTLLAVSIASVTSAAQASSFALIEQSASGQGSAYAGAAAIGEDASTIYFNPAGMTRLSGQQLVFAGHIVSPNADYTDSGNSTSYGGGPLTGPNSSTGDPVFVPNFYYATELGNGIHAGIGVNVPFGLSTDYDNGWVGRYQALKSEISTININPALAWKVTDKVAVGFGVNIQYIDLELTNSVDSSVACGGVMQAEVGLGVTPLGCGDLATTPPSTASRDSSSSLTGSDTSYGWNAGILIDLSESSRIGLAYRSSIKHNVTGDATYNLDPVLAAESDNLAVNSGYNVLQNTSLEATAELPASFSFSYVDDIDKQWTALFDFTWTGWNDLGTITIIQPGTIPGRESTLNLDYQNTKRISVGVNYRADDKWIYRGGIAVDETPIRSAETTSARIPGNDRTWLSVGLGYKQSTDWSFDFGYSHLFISDADISSGPTSTSSGATLIGSYELSVDILSAQANYNF